MARLFALVVFLSAFVIMSSSANALLAFTDNDVYLVGDDLTFKVNRTANVNITGEIYNSSSDEVQNFTILNGSAGFVEYSYTPSPPLAADEYTITLTQNSDQVDMHFKVVSEIFDPFFRLMGSEEAILVETSAVNDETGSLSGNFTELLQLNQSDSIYYGEKNLTGGSANISFVIVDEKKDTSMQTTFYDSIYVDDDRIFQLYNDTEDESDKPMVETSKKPGDLFDLGSGYEYIISDVEVPTGKKMFLLKPIQNPHFASGYNVNFTVFAKNSSGHIVSGITLNVTVSHVSRRVTWSSLIDIGNEGYVNTTFPIDGNYTPGKYFVLVNETPVEFFKVESFKLFGKITDPSDNPSYSFAPGAKAKIWAVGKDTSENLIALSPISGTLTKPDGSTETLSFSEVTSGADGIYSAETSTLTQTGEYKVVITAENSGNTEEFVMGLRVESVTMMVQTVNPKYVDEFVMVNAFPPGQSSNVSIAVFMINTTAGSAMKEGEGPPCTGESCVSVNCSDYSQFTVIVSDEEDNKWKLNGSYQYTNPDFQNPFFSSMTISDASQNVFIADPPDEAEIGDQCLIILWPGNYTYTYKEGRYKVDILFENDTIGELRGGASYSLQRYYASGSTVDFKGDSFSFLAPNSTVRIKLEIRDMETDNLLSGSDILDAKIIEMWKEWPERADAFQMTGYGRSVANASMNGTFLEFTSPPEEGFYHAKFRFKADFSGTVDEGIGDLFFDLKKYMIWADLESEGEGNWYVKPDDNITLTVNVMDIDMGSMYGEDITQTCTGCTGLIATVGAVRNEQFFKELEEGAAKDYTVTEGVIINSTSGATVVIDPVDELPSGWYGVDIILNDTENDVQYFGWGWFEVRNFWIDVFEVEESAGNYSVIEGEGKGGPGGGITLPAGGDTLLGVAAFSPPTMTSPPVDLTVTDIDVEGMMDDRSWPPQPIAQSKYTVTEFGEESFEECRGEYDCRQISFYLINLSLAGNIKESEYMLNLEATAQGAGTDLGTAWITVSSYVTDYSTVPENKKYEWPPTYSNSENLTLIFDAMDFDDNPRNITNVTIMEVFSDKMGRPVKFKMYDNYTNNCTGNESYCQLDINLSALPSGEYFAMLEIVDEFGSEQETEYMFEIKNMVFSVPQIYEGWAWEYSTPDKNIEAWFGEDTCDNERWLQPEQYPLINGTNVSAMFDGSDINITIPDDKTPSAGQPHYFWGIFCIETNRGSWRQASSASDCPGGEYVYVVNNGTRIWVNETTNMSSSVAMDNTSTFELPVNYPGLTWKVVTLRETQVEYMHVNLDGYICGRNETGGLEGNFLQIVPPVDAENHSSFYHGPNYIIGNMWQQGQPDQNSLEVMLDIQDRPAYVYHNTTHLWIFPGLSDINFTDSQAQGPAAPGAVISDGYGGNWEVVSISKGQISLSGQNILENGIMVNTSLSTSGRIRLGGLEEEHMGFEDKFMREKEGLDLDGDGEKNSTLYFLILDSGTGYDKLIYSNYSQKWNFTDETYLLDLNDPDRANRQVGFGDKLTLLNIDPRASQALFYDPSATGDWPELGDFKLGSNITIPIVVRTPSGSPVEANVSVPTMKVKTESGMSFVSTGLSAVEINGIGEIRINVSALGHESGRYEFEIKVTNDTIGTEQMNEWMWPRAQVRNFLVDSYSGQGGIVTDFVSMSVDWYGGWDSLVRPRELATMNKTDQDAHRAVMAPVEHELGPFPPSCTDFDEPNDAGSDGGNRTYVLDWFDGQYYAYMTPANPGKMWLKQSNCNFSQASNYTAGDPVNITLGSETYMLYVLNASIDNGAIGLTNFPSNIDHVRMDSWGENQAPKWQIMSVNLSGTLYNVVFANDSLLYPQAGTWGVDEISKVVWVDTDGNFSDAQKKVIGDTIGGGNKYLARIGPGAWEGILIANSTNLSSIDINVNPGMDLRVMDSTPVYFGKINESHPDLMLDLNVDDDMDDIFYVVAFDDFDDGQQEVSRIYVDDDLNISEPWWANSSYIQDDELYQYYDFYGDEVGMQEREGNTPKGMWGGHIEFAPRNSSLSWQDSAEWNVKTYNNTKMILEKDIWKLNQNKTVSLTVKAFDFAQSPLVGANVTLVKLMRFGGGQPFKELQLSTDYNLTNVQNVTDSDGYGMLKLKPPGSGWLDGAEHIAMIEIEYNGQKETVDNWFRIGDEEMP